MPSRNCLRSLSASSRLLSCHPSKGLLERAMSALGGPIAERCYLESTQVSAPPFDRLPLAHKSCALTVSWQLLFSQGCHTDDQNAKDAYCLQPRDSGTSHQGILCMFFLLELLQTSAYGYGSSRNFGIGLIPPPGTHSVASLAGRFTPASWRPAASFTAPYTPSTCPLIFVISVSSSLPASPLSLRGRPTCMCT
jgi:hypothetical protein